MFVAKIESAPGSALSYEELAHVYQQARKGNAAAAIALSHLPAAEQRLARMLCDEFGGQVVKAAKPKAGKVSGPKVRKGGKHGGPAGPDALRASLVRDLGSYDAAVREAARQALESL